MGVREVGGRGEGEQGKGELQRDSFGREVCAALPRPSSGGCRRGGTKMVEGIKTAPRRYLLSLRFRGLPRRFHGNYYFRWKILRVMNQVSRASTDVVSQSNFSRWEKPPDLPPYFFLLLCFLESRENFGNYFVRAAYLSATKSNCKLTISLGFPFPDFVIILPTKHWLYFLHSGMIYSLLRNAFFISILARVNNYHAICIIKLMHTTCVYI